MYSYLNSKVTKIRGKNIRIDINEFSSYKKIITEKVKEKCISNMIYNLKHEMDNMEYYIIKNLAEILILYDEFEYFYESPIPQEFEDDLKKLNKRLIQVAFIPKKIKAEIIRDKFELLSIMQIHGYEVNSSKYLIFYREIIMYYFLQDENLKKSLSRMKYVYIKKDNKFVRQQIYCNRNLKKKNHFQPIIEQVLRFYFFNKLYYENKIKIPVIGYKNNIPVLNPKFFKLEKNQSLLEIIFKSPWI